MPSQITSDHQVIKNWVEQNDGTPQRIDDPTATGDSIGIRINFNSAADKDTMPQGETHDISWQEFFKRFDDQQLAFVYSTDLKPSDTAGKKSDSYRFIKREVLENNDQAGQEYLNKQSVMKEFMNPELD